MTITDQIKVLCDHRHITIAALERTLDFGNGTIRRWSTTSPSVEKLKMVADYFDVNVDYLIGNPSLQKPPKDIAKHLEFLISELTISKDGPLFYGIPLDATDKALLSNALQHSLDIIKINHHSKSISSQST